MRVKIVHISKIIEVHLCKTSSNRNSPDELSPVQPHSCTLCLHLGWVSKGLLKPPNVTGMPPLPHLKFLPKGGDNRGGKPYRKDSLKSSNGTRLANFNWLLSFNDD